MADSTFPQDGEVKPRLLCTVVVDFKREKRCDYEAFPITSATTAESLYWDALNGRTGEVTLTVCPHHYRDVWDFANKIENDKLRAAALTRTGLDGDGY